MVGWCGGRFEKVGDSKKVDGRQGYTVVEKGSKGSRRSF